MPRHKQALLVAQHLANTIYILVFPLICHRAITLVCSTSRYLSLGIGVCTGNGTLKRWYHWRSKSTLQIITHLFLEVTWFLLIPQSMSSNQSYCKIAAGLCSFLTVDLPKLEPSPQQLTTACISEERGKDCVITSTFFFIVLLCAQIQHFFYCYSAHKSLFCSSGTVVPKETGVWRPH